MNGHAVNIDFTDHRIAEPAEQADEGRLAGAGGSQDRGRFAAGNPERDIVQGEFSFPVIEKAHACEFDSPVEAGEGSSRRRAGRGFPFEKLHDILHRAGQRDQAQPCAVKLADLRLQPVKHEQEDHHGRHRVPRAHAGEQNSQEQSDIENLRDRRHGAMKQVEPEINRAHLSGYALEQLLAVRLQAEHLNHLDAFQRVEHLLAHGRVRVHALPAEAPRPESDSPQQRENDAYAEGN